MLILTILSLILMVLYVIMLYVKNRGIPIHLSQSYYIFKHKFIFSAFLFLLTAMLLPVLLEVTPTNYQFLSFLTGASIIFIAATPNFMNRFEGVIHDIAAYIAVAASQTLILLTKPIILTTWIVLAISMLLYKMLKDKNSINYIFWIEIIGILNIFILAFLYL